MKDSEFRTLMITLIRPLLGTLVAAFIQSFFLSFTDFGIPASVGGKYDVVASVLYNKMLGSIQICRWGSCCNDNADSFNHQYYFIASA